MAKHMLIDATHPEEIRVVVVDGKRLEEFDIELASKKQLKGNIYLAKVTRVEPSLQAAFVEYGGNRHGFLAFSEIHPDYYRIPVADREALLAEEAREAAAEYAREEARDAAAEARPPRRRGGRGRAAESRGEPAGGEAEETPEEAGAAETDGDDESTGNRVPPELWPAQALGFGSDRLVSSESYDDEAADEEDAIRATPVDTSAPEAAAEPGGTAAEAGEAAEDGPGAATDVEPLARGEGSDDESGAGTLAESAETPGVETLPAEAKPVAVEVIGGDEADEVQPRRSTRALRSYKIQEVIKRRQVMLVQVTKEERGTKGAALTTYLSLAGRYCVLMPNTARGGGVSRKISSPVDRKRLKAILEELEIPEGMAVIIRTAGAERSKAELKRDYEYLLRLWDEIRELTLKSTAPALVYEEANLIKRSIRDLYSRDIEDVIVDGEDGYKVAKSFMRTLTPSHAKRVQLYRDPTPLFHRYQVESQLDAIHNPVVQLKSGGYIVINSTEALVAIDVNSGRATRERNIEETAYKTNLEAAEEIARQLRLRDLAGLIVIDFIDMEEGRHNAAVERRLKESMRHDRARIQIGRISAFGLLELSRQRMRPSLFETSNELCQYCRGTGHVRSTESTVLHVLRSIEDECLKSRNAEGMSVAVPTPVALYILNHKRKALAEIELRHGMRIFVTGDDHLIPPEYRVERLKALAPGEQVRPPVIQAIAAPAVDEVEDVDEVEEDEEIESAAAARAGGEAASGEAAGDERRRKRPRRRRRGRGREGGAESGAERERQPARARSEDLGEHEPEEAGEPAELEAGEAEVGEARPARPEAPGEESAERRRRRRGRRGGRRRRRGGAEDGDADQAADGTGAEEGVEEAAAAGEIEYEAEAEGEGEGAGAEEAEAEAVEAPGGRRGRRGRGRGRRPQGETAPTAGAEAEAGAETIGEVAMPAVRQPVPEPEPVPGQPLELPAEPAGGTAEPAEETEQPPLAAAPAEPDSLVEAERGAAAVPAPLEAPAAEPEPSGPPRRGWWRRLAQ